MPVGLRLMNWAKGLTRSQGWSGFVRTDTRALRSQPRMKGGFVSAERVEGEGLKEKQKGREKE